MGPFLPIGSPSTPFDTYLSASPCVRAVARATSPRCSSNRKPSPSPSLRVPLVAVFTTPLLSSPASAPEFRFVFVTVLRVKPNLFAVTPCPNCASGSQSFIVIIFHFPGRLPFCSGVCPLFFFLCLSSTRSSLTRRCALSQIIVNF